MTIIGYILLSYLIVIVLYFGVPYCVKNHLKKRFLSTTKKSGRICLTFDDGPNPESTPDILALLEELEIKATFFLIGQNVEKHPELFDEIVRKGHEIGDHGYRHVHAWACFPFCAVIDLIRGKSAIQKQYDAKPPFWLRPPYGKLNLITLCYVLLCRRKLAFWNVDPRDYQAQSPEVMSAVVLDQITGGSVILFHERSFYSNAALQGNLTAIKMIVQELRQNGYAFAKVSEVMAETGSNEPEYQVSSV